MVLTMLVAASIVVRPYVRGVSLVVRAADMRGALRSIADFEAARVAPPVEIALPNVARGPIAARLYRPEGTPQRFVLLVPGLHAAGVDEPRLVSLATSLAASGLGVVTPDLPELSRFEIAPAIADAIEAAAGAVAELSALEGAADGRIGVIGLSFSGGLSVVAAGRESLRERVAFVLSVNGHHDLPRVLRYLCLGATGSPGPPDYGVGVILLNVAGRVVPARQAGALRDTVRRFLGASDLMRVDPARADQELAAIRKLAASMPEPSATLVRYLYERDVAHLGSRLLPYAGPLAAPPALSPARSPRPRSPVFLLHGAGDTVIPASESEHLAGELVGKTPVRLQLTGILDHTGVTRPPGLGEALQLGGFWGDVLAR